MPEHKDALTEAQANLKAAIDDWNNDGAYGWIVEARDWLEELEAELARKGVR